MRERERETERQRDRERQRETERDRERQREREREQAFILDENLSLRDLLLKLYLLRSQMIYIIIDIMREKNL